MSQSRVIGTSRGFTLVELLLVMFVMSVLVALVVGVGSYVVELERKKETVATQERWLAALEAYRNVTQKYPDTNTTILPGGTNEKINTYPGSMSDLVAALQGAKDPSMTAKIYQATKAYVGEGSTGSTTVPLSMNDAYGTPMRYYKDKGVGGKPLILSAGPDADFGVTNDKKRTDNIRSDTRE
jgi:prepilin-type N-terminal cleavage/methylation domain-containing protein